LDNEGDVRLKKRQRTGMPTTSDNVIEIDDDDLAINPKASSQTTPAPLAQQASNQSSQMRRRPAPYKHKRAPRISEFWGVEKTVQMVPRCGNPQLNEIEDSEDEFTRSATEERKRRNAMSNSEHVDLKKQEQELRPTKIAVEIPPPEKKANNHTGQDGDVKLQDAFVQVDGKRRNSDFRDSPDELQGDKTVRDSWAVSSQRGRQLSPSKIRITNFSSKNTRAGTSAEKLFAVKQFISGAICRDSGDQNLVLVFDKNVLKFILKTSRSSVGKIASIDIRKALKITFGSSPSSKIRLHFPKCSDSESTTDIKFSSEKESADFCRLVQELVCDIRVIERSP
jgi:hypothetical protein